MATDKTQDKTLSIRRSEENHQEKQDKKSHTSQRKETQDPQKMKQKQAQDSQKI